MTEITQETFAENERIRLNLISEVALASDGQPRPIHILRTGTFTSMTGRVVTFEADDIRQIAANFQAGKRRKPPITERHDFGRAIGRMVNVYTDAGGENLYAQPKWTSEGRQLLSDEVYDGFSVELDGGHVLIGGSLTNYPAVDGLEPVTLSAPPMLDTAPLPLSEPDPEPQATTLSDAPIADVRDTATQPRSTITMEEQTEEFTLPPAPPPDALVDRQAAYLAQIEARVAAREQAAFERAEAAFERRIQALEQRNTIEAFAQARTITSINQPWALPTSPDELSALLAETPSGVRGKWMTLLTRLTTAGLVSFDEIGSSGEAAEAADQWATLVNANVARGMTRVAAIKAVAKDYPALYNAQQTPKRGGR